MPITKNGRAITTIDDWFTHAKPKAPYHWVDGRSAKEAARAWLGNSEGQRLPQEVESLLASHPRFGPVLSWEGEPEARLRFDEFPGEPRNSDLAIIATDAFGPYVLAVEAKADEPFDETVAETFAAALERRIGNPRSNGIARIAALASLLLPARTQGAPRAAELRYQLLAASAGAIAEAARRSVRRAVMLVHEFVTPATFDVNHARNASDLHLFLHRLTGHPLLLEGGELAGPIVPPGAVGIELFVGKAIRNLRLTGS